MKRWIQNILSPNTDKPSITQLDWMAVRNSPTKIVNRRRLLIGEKTIHKGRVTISDLGLEIPVETLLQARKLYGDAHPLEGGFSPQLAAIVYDITSDPNAMTLYFPLLSLLSESARDDFQNRVKDLIADSHFDIHVHSDNRAKVKDHPSCIAYMVAGHITEIFFYRQDIVEQFFMSPRSFNLYMTQRDYIADGGMAGGCYDPRTGSIKLVASRLFEGFYSAQPGVAPFIHEFGHMLDHFDVSTKTMASPNGLLPGMARSDAHLFSPIAREAFLKGKRLELERYQQAREYPPDEKHIPIGHPYVFQNDGEFLAGYLEMFFRNPNYFRDQNPDLYIGFQELLQQDPREYRKQDFMFYVDQNKAAYLLQGDPIPPAGLKVLE